MACKGKSETAVQLAFCLRPYWSCNFQVWMLAIKVLAANMSSTRFSHHMVQVHTYNTLSIPGSSVSQSYEANLMQLSTCSSILEPACAPYMILDICKEPRP